VLVKGEEVSEHQQTMAGPSRHCIYTRKCYVMSEWGTPISLQEQMDLLTEVPGKWSKHQLTGGTTSRAKGIFGEVYSSYFRGEGFTIWFNNYRLLQSTSFIWRYPAPLLLLQMAWLNESTIICEGLDESNCMEQQFDMYYAPTGRTTTAFNDAQHGQTFSIAIEAGFLTPYAKHCSKLQELLENAAMNKPAAMLRRPRFLSLDMIHIITKIINYKGEEGLAPFYFNSLVQELLTLMCIQVNLVAGGVLIPSIDLQQAQEAQKMILADFEVYLTVEELAKKAGTTEIRLQVTFKYLYGQTVAKFSREARLAMGHRLLEQTTYPLRVVCEMVGYPDPANFSVAFKKQYGYWPGKIQQQARQIAGPL
jgi:AraC-like DNA-binding protein